MDVLPQLAGIIGILAAGPFVDDFVISVARADRTTGDRQSPLPHLVPRKISPKTDTNLPFGADRRPESVHVTPQRSVSRGPVRSATLPFSSGTAASTGRASARARRFFGRPSERGFRLRNAFGLLLCHALILVRLSLPGTSRAVLVFAECLP